MRGDGTGTKRRRVRITLLAGAAGGLVAAGLRVARSRGRRRREAGEKAFSRASDGLWPPVPPAPERQVRIEAERAAAAQDPVPDRAPRPADGG